MYRLRTDVVVLEDIGIVRVQGCQTTINFQSQINVRTHKKVKLGTYYFL